MTAFLVERYWPGVSVDAFRVATAQLRTTIEQMAAAGEPIELLHATLVPADESTYAVIAASGPERVEAACRNAGLPYERLLAAEVSRLT
jgi:hypothetical protein